jgi:fatty-acyl-CoA synthase
VKDEAERRIGCRAPPGQEVSAPVTTMSDTGTPTRSVRSLVQPDRVHSDVYTDPQIFAQELDRIFHGGWVYVAHASEVAQSGDYVMKTIGTQPMIVTRDAAGEVQVLFNRCSHLANLLCHDPKGNSGT